MTARQRISSLPAAVIARGFVALFTAAMITAGLLLLAGAVNLLNWNACMCAAGGDDGPLYLKTFLLWVCIIAVPLGAVIASWRIPLPAPIPLTCFAAVGTSLPLLLPFGYEEIGQFLAREGLFTSSRLVLAQADVPWVALTGAGLSLAALHSRTATASILATSTWLLLIGTLSITDANLRESTSQLGLLTLATPSPFTSGLTAFGLPAYGAALIAAWATWSHTRRTHSHNRTNPLYASPTGSPPPPPSPTRPSSPPAGPTGSPSPPASHASSPSPAASPTGSTSEPNVLAGKRATALLSGLFPALAGIVPVAVAYLIAGSGTEGQHIGYGFAVVLLITSAAAGLAGGMVAAWFNRVGPFHATPRAPQGARPAWVQLALLAVLVSPVLGVSLINLG